MTSVRIRKDQLERLKKTGNVCASINIALERFFRNEFVIKKETKTSKHKNILQIVSIPFEINVTSSILRMILDAHFENPDLKRKEELQKQIDEQDKLIADLFAQYGANQKYIFEKQS